MKLVTAIVRPSRVDVVKEALKAKGVLGMTLSDVNGFGRQFGHTEIYRGTEYNVEFVPKSKLEILCDDPAVAEIVDAIAEAARSDNVGDGKIWVIGVEEVVRIRTGERGTDAI
ncbi:MAG TPA: P-II family nitrogen regulator [Acidimicrobiia bacterium]|nr:P-II family nitrogen regulator [Acidimicrobiia bacterium]